MTPRPLSPIALTPGEPAGIGPDLCLRLAAQALERAPVVIADPDLLAERARHLNLAVELAAWDARAAPGPHVPGRLLVDAVAMPAPVRCGHPDPSNAPYVLETLRRAVTGCLDGRFAALVTGPVHKEVINQAGIPFTGHTEFLAQLTGAAQVVMMLAVPGLRVALATTHLPLREVGAALTPARLEPVLRVLYRDLRERFGIARPRVLVCGLNPHAGEGGYLGREEIEVITPVLERLRDEGMALEGPLPADTAFVPAALARADAVLAMYHDQGLPVLKHRGFGQAVNITLGLPIIRTSVDHGTALDLAGTGRGELGSLLAAYREAEALAAQQDKDKVDKATTESTKV